jgi:hypothetical protein
MRYHFLILSGESEDFLREIAIDSDATFFNLHQAIQSSVDYDPSQIASFYMSDEDWSKGLEITLIQMDTTGKTESLIMDKVKLNELIIEKKERLIYQFDFFSNRGFFIEVIAVNESLKPLPAAVVRAEGEAPDQLLLDDLGLDSMDALLGLSDTEDGINDEFDDIRFEDLDTDSYEEYF